MGELVDTAFKELNYGIPHI